MAKNDYSPCKTEWLKALLRERERQNEGRPIRWVRESIRDIRAELKTREV